MLDLAEDYRKGHNVLSEHWWDPPANSATLLAVIEFEILLKCAVLLEKKVKLERPTHNYYKLWRDLDVTTQDRLLHSANCRMPGIVNLSDIQRILNDLEKTFKKGRYSYELNDHRSDAEARKAGNVWIKNGAIDEDADILYRPHECFALSHSLRDFCENLIHQSRETDTDLSL